ncbi:MAG: glycosyltransferase 61 family protein [Alphaproteobacteria bacterium]
MVGDGHSAPDLVPVGGESGTGVDGVRRSLFLNHFREGVVAFADEQLEKAAACFLRATLFQPDNAAAMFNHATVLCHLKRWELAEEAYRRTLVILPGHGESHLWLGFCLMMQWRPDDARGPLERARRLLPNDVRPSEWLSWATKERLRQSKGSPQFENFVNEANQARFPDLPPEAFDTFEVEIQDLSDWYQSASPDWQSWCMPFTPVSPTLIDVAPPHMHDTLYRLMKTARLPVSIAHDADVEVLHFRYLNDDDSYHYFSGRRRILNDNAFVRHAETWPFLYRSDDLKVAIVSLPRPRLETIDVLEPCIFLNSRTNYGHWLSDVYAKLMLLEHCPETAGLPIVCYDLRPYQYETLDLLGIPRDRMVMLRPRLTDDIPHLIRLSHASLPSFVPFPVVHAWLRETLTPRFRGAATSRPRRIYFTRRNYHPRSHRVDNEAEVVACLDRFGFVTLPADTLSVAQTMDLVANCDIVVCPYGGTITNNIFLREDAAWIDLINPIIHETNWVSSRLIPQTVPLTGRWRIVSGPYVDPRSSLIEDVLERFDAPFNVDIAALEATLVELLAETALSDCPVQRLDPGSRPEGPTRARSLSIMAGESHSAGPSSRAAMRPLASMRKVVGMPSAFSARLSRPRSSRWAERWVKPRPSRKRRTVSAERSSETVTTSMPEPARAALRRSREGNSRIHGGHQVAQRFSTTPRPLKSERRTSAPLPSRKGTSGAVTRRSRT